MRASLVVCCLFFFIAVTTRAEIEKNAQICDTGICLYWWPKLPSLKGWHQDKDQSYNYGVNALAPDGSTFAKAPAVMYAEASYKPRMPEIKSLDALIAQDKQNFVSHFPDMAITQITGLGTADGKTLRTFTFFPKSKGEWEEVSYGEEGDFYLTFTLSSHSKQAFDGALPEYRELIAHYKEHPGPEPSPQNHARPTSP
jgi:hypothetical protein